MNWLSIKSKIRPLIPSSLLTFYRKYRFSYPYNITISHFPPLKCRFEITSFAEQDRVITLGYEEDFIRQILSELNEGDRFFDIGSCIGLIALHAGKKGVNVTAFEPDPGYRQRLIRQREVNQLEDRVQIIDWAVSDEAGTCELFTEGVSSKSPSLQNSGDRTAVTVPTNSIDQALEKGILSSPDVVKIDIEGAEILCLKGMQELLGSDKSPRTIFIEIHPEFLKSFSATPEDCELLITKHGYTKSFESDRDGQLHAIYTKQQT